MTTFQIVASIITIVISVFGLGLGFRRLEKNEMARRDIEKKAVHDKFAALELTISEQRSELIRLANEVRVKDEARTTSYEELRGGVIAMENRLNIKVDENVRVVESSAGSVDTIMKLVKVK